MCSGRFNLCGVGCTLVVMATHRTLTMAVLTLAAALSLSVGAAADSITDPYRTDPLGLVAHYDLTSTIATGGTTFEVWICDTHPNFVTPTAVVSTLCGS